MASSSITKQNLVYAYNICSMLGLDDHTYTHLSCRSKCDQGFHIQQFGLKFAEISLDNLLTVSFSGAILAGEERIYNKTGYQTHGVVYKARPDVGAIFHLHTPSMVAVSAMEEGLLPISQWALHFYDRIAYHAYDSLVLDDQQSAKMIQDLGMHSVMLMRNHGCLIAAKTIHEAMFYTHHLELACQTQVKALSMQRGLSFPSADVCEKTVRDLLSFEDDLGIRDWYAWVRQLNRHRVRSTTAV